MISQLYEYLIFFWCNLNFPFLKIFLDSMINFYCFYCYCFDFSDSPLKRFLKVIFAFYQCFRFTLIGNLFFLSEQEKNTKFSLCLFSMLFIWLFRFDWTSFHLSLPNLPSFSPRSINDRSLLSMFSPTPLEEVHWKCGAVGGLADGLRSWSTPVDTFDVGGGAANRRRTMGGDDWLSERPLSTGPRAFTTSKIENSGSLKKKEKKIRASNPHVNAPTFSLSFYRAFWFCSSGRVTFSGSINGTCALSNWFPFSQYSIFVPVSKVGLSDRFKKPKLNSNGFRGFIFASFPEFRTKSSAVDFSCCAGLLPGCFPVETTSMNDRPALPVGTEVQTVPHLHC